MVDALDLPAFFGTLKGMCEAIEQPHRRVVEIQVRLVDGHSISDYHVHGDGDGIVLCRLPRMGG